MSQALYRKWRPQSFDDVVGQEPIVRTLRNALRTGHIHHAYLFAGPRGTGKTTSARLVAKAVNCLAPIEERPCNKCEICNAVNEARLMDLIEIDAASNTGVDNIRELLERVSFRPTQARYKVYVIDEVHMLSTSAFNALLKTLEEPPEHVIFVLATTEVHKIPATVLSRCQRFEFRRIPLPVLVQRLQKICEGEDIDAEPEALDLIARTATGSMRDAISLLDQMAADKQVTADYVRLMLGAERREVVHALAQAWINHDLTNGLQLINRAVDGGADPRQLARQFSDFLRGLLLMRLGAGETWTDPTAEERPHFIELAQQAETQALVKAVRLFSEAASQRRAGWQPQLPLELALVEATLDPQTAAAPIPQPDSRTHAPAPRPVPAQVKETKPRQTKPPAAPKATATANTTQTPESKPAPAATPSTDANVPVAEIGQRWREILRQLSPPVAAPMWDAQPLGVDSKGALVLGFRHAFHLKKTNEEGYRRAVEDVLTQMFNQPICLRCILEKDWKNSAQEQPAAQPSAAAPPAPQPPEPPTEPVKENALQEDQVVQRAVKELGAVPKVVEK